LRATVAEGSAEPGTVLTADGVIACGAGAIRLLEIQRAGKRPMAIAEALRGFALSAGARVR
jgi:methionyl-tRNA formyltransferase